MVKLMPTISNTVSVINAQSRILPTLLHIDMHLGNLVTRETCLLQTHNTGGERFFIQGRVNCSIPPCTLQLSAAQPSAEKPGSVAPLDSREPAPSEVEGRLCHTLALVLVFAFRLGFFVGYLGIFGRSLSLLRLRRIRSFGPFWLWRGRC